MPCYNNYMDLILDAFDFYFKRGKYATTGIGMPKERAYDCAVREAKMKMQDKWGKQ